MYFLQGRFQYYNNSNQTADTNPPNPIQAPGPKVKLPLERYANCKPCSPGPPGATFACRPVEAAEAPLAVVGVAAFSVLIALVVRLVAVTLIAVPAGEEVAP